jgi:hypothetical protein
MKKLIALSIFCLSQAAFALQAPFLYTADSASDTTVQLTWRNNSTAYLGIIVLRKTAATGQYSVVDTAPGTATAFTDTVRPAAQTTYYYALTAYSQTEQADTSNVDSARVTPKPSLVVFSPPLRFRVSWDSTSHSMSISFFDSSTIEKGYKIFRSTNFGTPLMIKDIPSAVPSLTGTISFNDSSVSANAWYLYYGTVYSGDSSLTSQSDTIFTFDQNAMTSEMIKNASKKCILSNKISSFPIKYKSWSLEAGDTIVLNERGTPTDSMFSIINVSSPTNPTFAGTGTSVAAQIDTTTMSGACAMTKGQDIFGCYSFQLYAFEYQNGIIRIINSVQSPDFFSHINPYFLSETTLVIAGSYSVSMGLVEVSTGYSLAQYTFANNSLTFVDTTSFLPTTTDGMSGGDWDQLLGSIVWNGRYIVNAYRNASSASGNGPTMDSCAEIVDFNYPSLPKYCVSHFLAHSPLIVDGILFEDSILRKMNNVMMDTVKNLVFALSDSELSVYNCQIVSGISHPVPSTHLTAQILHVGKGANGSASLIFLPHHTQPAAVSIFDLSGRRIARMEGIQGETVAWPHQNRAGVYILRAVLDGTAITAKVILNK